MDGRGLCDQTSTPTLESEVDCVDVGGFKLAVDSTLYCVSQRFAGSVGFGNRLRREAMSQPEPEP